jgi:large subunit ribosomal protein L22
MSELVKKEKNVKAKVKDNDLAKSYHSKDADLKTAEAKVKSIKISPIKLSALTRSIKGLPVNKAVSMLTFSTKRVAKDINNLLKSAMANAENNHGLDIDKLYIKRIDVGKALVLKRFTARGRGRGSRILKPFSNVRIVLAERV